MAQGSPPVINRTMETGSVLFPGDCFGVSINADITWHIDPAVWYEVEVLASVDGGQTYTISIGKAGRWGGVAIEPVTGGISTVMKIDTDCSRACCTDPRLKAVTRTSSVTGFLPQPYFWGVSHR
jgi:hypothetical protein